MLFCYNIIQDFGDIMNTNDLGERITRRRENLELTQDQLAELLGVTRQTISKWELGTSNPDVYHLMLLCNILKVTSEELLFGIENYDNRIKDQKIDELNSTINNLNGAISKSQNLIAKLHKKGLIIFIALFLIIIVLSIAFGIYYKNNLDKNMYIYDITGEHALIKPIHGIIVKSKDEAHVQIINIISNNRNKEIENIKLYYMIGDKEFFVASALDGIIKFKDIWGYNEYIDFYIFDDIINNLFISFEYDGNTEIVELKSNLIYTNNKYKYTKSKSSIKDINHIEDNKEIKKDFLHIVGDIKKKYKCEENNCWVTYNGYNISFFNSEISIVGEHDGYKLDLKDGALSYFDYINKSNNFISYYSDVDCKTQKCKFKDERMNIFWQIINTSLGNS